VRHNWGWALLLLIPLGIAVQKLQSNEETARKTREKTAVQVLEPRYNNNLFRYRHPRDNAPWTIQHRLGIFNLAEHDIRHVRLHLTSMTPRPRNVLNDLHPVIPYRPPLLSGGDASIGITLGPRTEELWVLGYTSASTGSDGSLNAGGFAPPDQRWRGLYWQVDPNERWRFSYEITADDVPPVRFSIVLYAEAGQLRLDLEG
jgi:hypothetical protein